MYMYKCVYVCIYIYIIMFCSHVDPEYTTATDQSKTICIPCQDATPEARAHYPPEWCQDMVPKDMLTQSQSKWQEPLF